MMKGRQPLITSIEKISLFKNRSQSIDCYDLKRQLFLLGIIIDIKTGHLSYINEFEPYPYDFDELVVIRHGETWGNCGQITSDGKVDKSATIDKEKRIFQGNVDSEINQLTEHGKQQAIDAAQKMKDEFLSKGWIPDVILHSPLTRAYQTGLPFVKQNGFEDRYVMNENIREMSFGAYENRRVCDIDPKDPCHSFYKDQNALIKKSSPQQDAEHFCDVILRAHQVLLQLQKNYPRKKILMFSHSMFGAACRILLGKGQKIKDEDKDHLAFDGQSYTMPHATPFPLYKAQSIEDHLKPSIRY
jgi:broad specificity phosphatase PhoE